MSMTIKLKVSISARAQHVSNAFFSVLNSTLIHI